MSDEQVHRWIVFGKTIVAFTLPGPIPDRLWDGFVAALDSQPLNHSVSLSLGPVNVNSVQRKKAAEILQKKGIHSIVVTDDRLTRGLATAVSWLGANLKAFNWGDIETAIRLTGESEDDQKAIVGVALEFRRNQEQKAG